MCVITEAAKDPFGSSGDEDKNMHLCDHLLCLTKRSLDLGYMFSFNWAMRTIYKDRNQ